MVKRTYKEAFDLITQAYINNKLNPYDGCQCFIGNLLGNDSSWENARWGYGGGTMRESYSSATNYACTFIRQNSIYTPVQILSMEENFLRIIAYDCSGDNSYLSCYYRDSEDSGLVRRVEHPGYEDSLFRAMESTLDMLREIHISLGETIEETPFVKRQLQTA